jgi:hypothetical protein
MTKVVVGMSMSLDGIAGPEPADRDWQSFESDKDGMGVFAAVLGWVFPLRSWREQQGQEGGEDSVDSRVWGDNFARFGPQIIGRTMFDYGFENWGENPPFHAGHASVQNTRSIVTIGQSVRRRSARRTAGVCAFSVAPVVTQRAVDRRPECLMILP